VQGPLEYRDKDKTVCPRCRLAYRIEDDIPNMLLQAEKSPNPEKHPG
jgi:uncharacterized protein YbaR (Trm112 family)